MLICKQYHSGRYRPASGDYICLLHRRSSSEAACLCQIPHAPVQHHDDSHILLHSRRIQSHLHPTHGSTSPEPLPVKPHLNSSTPTPPVKLRPAFGRGVGHMHGYILSNVVLRTPLVLIRASTVIRTFQLFPLFL